MRTIEVQLCAELAANYTAIRLHIKHRKLLEMQYVKNT
jgi:hypothetical protein